jgi:hypothetical protein
LPWLGYFSKLAFCNVFVVLDNVEFTKGQYLDRTRVINTHGDVGWLSLQTGQNFKLPISQVELKQTGCIPKIIRTVREAYATANNFDSEWPFVEELLSKGLTATRLLDVNIGIMHGLLSHVRISEPEFILSSHLSENKDPTGRILEICEKTKITRLILGSGNSGKVHDLNRLSSSGIRTFIQDYKSLHPQYSQARRRKREFVPGLSIIDALLNVGAAQVKTFVSDLTFSPLRFDNAEDERLTKEKT